MAVMFQLADTHNELVVTVNIGGAYSPDILDDSKRRVKELYQETIAFQIAASGPTVVHEDYPGGVE